MSGSDRSLLYPCLVRLETSSVKAIVRQPERAGLDENWVLAQSLLACDWAIAWGAEWLSA